MVLTSEEVKAAFSCLGGVPWLVCSLLYGAGLRLLEAVGLRLKDVDFRRKEILVRDAKGTERSGDDTAGCCPAKAVWEHLERVCRQHQLDLGRGLGRVPLPDALARKYPDADRQWGWQWVFPAATHFVDRRRGCGTAGTYMSR